MLTAEQIRKIQDGHIDRVLERIFVIIQKLVTKYPKTKAFYLFEDADYWNEISERLTEAGYEVSRTIFKDQDQYLSNKKGKSGPCLEIKW